MENYLEMIRSWLNGNYSTKVECVRAFGYNDSHILVDAFNPKYCKKAAINEITYICKAHPEHRDSGRFLNRLKEAN